MELQLGCIPSPLGDLLLGFRGETLYGLDYGNYRSRLEQRLQQRWRDLSLVPANPPTPIVTALRDYFAGHLPALQTLAVDPGGTPFQQRVWTALRHIPPAEVVTYGTLARQLRSPGAARAVGLANRCNPVAIAIPCHRVIGRNGHLTGYAGGLERKRWLLAHEQHHWQGTCQPNAPQQLNLFP